MTKIFGYGFITLTVITESLNVFVWLSPEVNPRMRQGRKRCYLWSAKVSKSFVSPSSEIQAIVDQLQCVNKFFSAAKCGLFDFDESCFESD